MADPARFEGIPEIIYGTAFKFENSASLVETALKAGFRAIDTAGSKAAYREALVGEGIAAALAAGTIQRKELYVSPHFLGSVPKGFVTKGGHLTGARGCAASLDPDQVQPF